MRQKVSNQQGMSLVETLAVVVISAFIIMTMFGIFFNGQKQVQLQTEKNYNLIDTAYIMKFLMKDIRKSDQVYDYGENGCISTLCISGIPYHLDSSGNLKKDEAIIAENIELFTANKEGNKLTISLKIKNSKEEKIEMVLR